LFKDYRMTFYIPIERSASWRGYTFIAPTVSVGNVGQLTVDLLVSTLNMKKVGLINDPALTPVIGNDPYAHSLSSRVGTLDLNQQHDGSSSSPCLMTGCEVYESSFHRLVVMQLRSPLIPGRQSAFLRRLLAFIREKELASTLFLSSCHAHERLDAQLSGDQFRYLATAAFCPRPPPATAASTDWIPLERRAHDHSARAPRSTPSCPAADWPGGRSCCVRRRASPRRCFWSSVRRATTCLRRWFWRTASTNCWKWWTRRSPDGAFPALGRRSLAIRLKKTNSSLAERLDRDILPFMSRHYILPLKY